MQDALAKVNHPISEPHAHYAGKKKRRSEVAGGAGSVQGRAEGKGACSRRTAKGEPGSEGAPIRQPLRLKLVEHILHHLK